MERYEDLTPEEQRLSDWADGVAAKWLDERAERSRNSAGQDETLAGKIREDVKKRQKK